MFFTYIFSIKLIMKFMKVKGDFLKKFLDILVECNEIRLFQMDED
jgi:hypothetical protein